MSDTPETDAFQSSGKAHYMAVEFARRLERERNEAMESRNECERQFQEKVEESIRLLCERDEAREKIEDVRKVLRCTIHEGPILAALRVIEERDEAMQQNAKLREIAERAINFGEFRAPSLAYTGPTWERLRAELDQLKEVGE